MNKEELLAIAAKARHYRDSYAKNKTSEKPLSYSDWMAFTERDVKSDAFIERTDAVIGLYNAEKEMNAQSDTNEVVVMGDKRYLAFPKLGELNGLRDEKDRLYKEESEIRKREEARIEQAKKLAKQKKAPLEAIPEENEKEERPLTAEEQKKREKALLQKQADDKKKAAEKAESEKDKKRLREIDDRLKALNTDWTALQNEYRDYLHNQEKENVKENHAQAKQDFAENKKGYENVEANEFIARAGLLCAAKDALSKRTWKDFLFHPFRSIGENWRYSDMKNALLEEFDVTAGELDAIVNTVGNGEERNLRSVASIEEDGIIRLAEQEIGIEEPKAEINLEEPKEKINLDAVFAPEEQEKTEPVKNGIQIAVEEPNLNKK